MVKPLELVEHKVDAEEKFLSQYKGSDNFRKLADIFLEELDALEELYAGWTEKIDLDTATGINLDYWAELLDSDMKPFGLGSRPTNDDVMRSLIYAVIGAYSSNGTALDIQQTLEKVLKADRVFIDDNLDGSFSFEVDNPTYIYGKELIANIVRIAKPVGVEFLGYTVSNIYGEPTFGFDTDPDENVLGFAVLASAQVASGYWENYIFAPAGSISTTERITTDIDVNNLSATMSIIQPKNGTVDGKDFVDDIMNEFNGVIGSKIGFDSQAIPSVPTVQQPNIIGQFSSIDFDDTNNVESYDNTMSKVVARIDKSDFTVDSEHSVNPGIQIYHSDLNEIEAMKNELTNNWPVNDVLTIYDNAGNRLDLKRLSSSNKLISNSNAYGYRTAWQNLNNTFDLPFNMPALDNATLNAISNGNISLFSFQYAQALASQGFGADWAQGGFEFALDLSTIEAWYMVQRMWEWSQTMDAKLAVVGDNGDDLVIINKEVRNTSFWLGGDWVANVDWDEAGDIYNLYFPITQGSNNNGPNYDTCIQVIKNGVLQSKTQVANEEIQITYNDYTWGVGNYDLMEDYQATIDRYRLMNPTPVIVDAPVNSTDFQTSLDIGMKNQPSGLSINFHDLDTSETIIETTFNGIKMSPRDALSRFGTYDYTQKTLFNTYNAPMNFHDIALQNQQSKTSRDMEYVYPNNTVSFGGEDVRIFVYNNRLGFASEVDSADNFTENLRSFLTVPGQAITIVDANGVSWEVKSESSDPAIVFDELNGNGISYDGLSRQYKFTLIELSMTNQDGLMGSFANYTADDFEDKPDLYYNWFPSGKPSQDTYILAAGLTTDLGESTQDGDPFYRVCGFAMINSVFYQQFKKELLEFTNPEYDWKKCEIIFNGNSRRFKIERDTGSSDPDMIREQDYGTGVKTLQFDLDHYYLSLYIDWDDGLGWQQTTPDDFINETFNDEAYIQTGINDDYMMKSGRFYVNNPRGLQKSEKYESGNSNNYDLFIANNPQGIRGAVTGLPTSWLIENLSTFDIVETSEFSDYYRIDINLSLSNVDNVALINDGDPKVIMALSEDEIGQLNIDESQTIDQLVKETTEGDGEIPEEGYSIKGGGRFSILNQ